MKMSDRQLSIDEAIARDAAIAKQKKKVQEKKQLYKNQAEDIVLALNKEKRSPTDEEREIIKQHVALSAPKKLRIRTQFNADAFDNSGEVNTGPSITVPDQTLSIREILEQHARGLGNFDGKVPLYSGGSDYLDGIDPRTLDLAEKFDILESVQERYNARRDELQKQQDDLRKKEVEDMIKAEVETRLKQKQLDAGKSTDV